MWTVKCDNYILFDDFHTIFNPILDLAMNKAGEFKFTIDSAHENFGKINLLKSVIDVYEDGALRFSGRPLSIDIDWNNRYSVVCEGELAYLNDIVVRPFSFPVDPTKTVPAEYFAYLISKYNEKVSPGTRRLTLGNIEVRDPNNYVARSDTEYSTVWALIKEGLLDVYGGWISFRHSDEPDEWGNPTTYIDYIQPEESGYPQPEGQFIRFGINLLDISTERDGLDIATAIIPLGAKDEQTEERLTISSLPDEPMYWDDNPNILKSGDYVYSSAGVNTYGKKELVLIYDDVTTAANLLKKAESYYLNSWKIKSTTTIKAIDLNYIPGFSVAILNIGDEIPVDSEPHETIHGFNNACVVNELHIELFSPENSTLTVEASISI